jgi:phage gpG-like protein
MILLTFNGTDQKVVNWLQQSGSKIVDALRSAMLEQMFELRDYVVGSKLSGQVLKTKTGTLRRAQVASMSSTASLITGVVATDPSAGYGYVHEYGGTFTVREHLRKTSRGTRRVREHDVTFPERSYLRSSLDDRSSAIVQALREAIQNVIDQGTT